MCERITRFANQKATTRVILMTGLMMMGKGFPEGLVDRLEIAWDGSGVGGK